MAAKKAKSATAADGSTATSAALPTTGPLAHVFGVRHLSPMGAWHLERFLEKIDPTAVLVEGPSDATDEIQYLIDERTKPPVALLSFTQKRPVRSVLYPLAAYSPEWVALRWALGNSRVARFIDLPSEVFLGQSSSEDAEDAEGEGCPHGEPTEQEAEAETTETDTQRYLGDPYTAIAELTGEPDHDAWWERQFEHSTEEDSYRLAIFEFGKQLRALEYESPARRAQTLLREAYMRRKIRQTITEGHDPNKIVVVCGAFHAPVLHADEPAMSDDDVAKLPRAAVTRTLMPYSYFRLSSQSGYGAGNKAPAYFQALFDEARKQGSTEGMGQWFLTELAGRLRHAGMIRSTADVIEAVRLANGVAALRDSHSPTLNDFESAAAACLGHGEPHVIGRFLREMVVGDAIGAVPPGVLRTSIQDDFQASIKDLGLQEYLKDKEQIIGTKNDPWLDLRKNRFVKSEASARRDLNRSTFLHRLDLLGIGFAHDITAEEQRKTHNWKETWKARWIPDCEINLVDNALRGDTVELAAAHKLTELLNACSDIRGASHLLRRAVICDLHDAQSDAMAHVQTLATGDGDLVAVAAAAREDLLPITTYGDVRDYDPTPLVPIIAQLFLRGVLLALDASRCNEDAARPAGAALTNLHYVANAFEDKLDVDRFVRTLDSIADDPFAAPHVAGVACAILLERGKLTDAVLDVRISRRLSPGVSPTEGAGFSRGSPRVIVMRSLPESRSGRR